MKRLNYQIYELAAGKSETQDNNNLYIDGVIVDGKIRSIASVYNQEEQLTKSDEQIINENFVKCGDIFVIMDGGAAIESYAKAYFKEHYSTHFPEDADISVDMHGIITPVGSEEYINQDYMNEDLSVDVDVTAEWEDEEDTYEYNASVRVPATVVKPTLRYVYYRKEAVK